MPESGSGTVGDSRVCFSEDMGVTVRCELGRAGAVFLLGCRRETYRFRFSDDFEEKELSKRGILPAPDAPIVLHGMPASNVVITLIYSLVK